MNNVLRFQLSLKMEHIHAVRQGVSPGLQGLILPQGTKPAPQQRILHKAPLQQQ